MSSPPASARAQFLLGMRTFIPVAISIASYGVVWGVLAGQAEMTPLEVLTMSGLLYAGSSQFVALTLWTPGALPIVPLIVAAAIINLRMLPTSATLREVFASVPRGRALLSMFLLSDEVWAMTMAQEAKGNNTPAFMLGCGALAWLSWVGSTIAGRLLGSVISDPATYGLDFAFTATFLALLFGMWKGKSDLVPWLTGALIAILIAQLLPGTWYIIAGGLGGSLIGALVEYWRLRHVA